MSTVLRAEPLTISIGSYTATFCPRVGTLGVAGESILQLVREKFSPERGDKLPEAEAEYRNFIKLVNRCWERRKLQQWRLARNSEHGRTYHASIRVGGSTYSVFCKTPIDTAGNEHFTDEDYKPLPGSLESVMASIDYSDLEKRTVAYMERSYVGFRAGRVGRVSTASRPHKWGVFHADGTPTEELLMKRFLHENGMTEQPEVAIEAPWLADEHTEALKKLRDEADEAEARCRSIADSVTNTAAQAASAISAANYTGRELTQSLEEALQQRQDMIKPEFKGRRYRAVFEAPVDKKLTFAVIGISLLAHIGLWAITAYRDGVPFWSLL